MNVQKLSVTTEERISFGHLLMDGSSFNPEDEGDQSGASNSVGHNSQEPGTGWYKIRRKLQRELSAESRAKIIFWLSWLVIVAFFSTIRAFRGGRGEIGEGADMVFGTFAVMYIIFDDKDGFENSKWRPLGSLIVCIFLVPLFSVIVTMGADVIRDAVRDPASFWWRMFQGAAAFCGLCVIIFLINRKADR